MESIKEIFRIGYGPSSSHTMGPSRVAAAVGKKYADAASFKVVLYGSLAATGKGHLTDKAIKDALAPRPVEFEWRSSIFLPKHPNALKITVFNSDDLQIGETLAYSVGGGKVLYEGVEEDVSQQIYPLTDMASILNWVLNSGRAFWEYVQEYEESDIWDYLKEVWITMKEAIERGINKEGVLPGGLNLPRKASSYYYKAQSYRDSMQRRGLLYAYALAVSEENASGGKVVTAPTCGSCGVLPSIMYLLNNYYNIAEMRILKALATAGLIGNIIKYNASISGAEVGCQGEIGSACAMSAGAAAQAFGGTPNQIEYAASIGLEHFLGLTCDPVCGLVQIPCIERNPMAASRALDADLYALLSDGRHFVPFDNVVRVMKQTGCDLPSIYKETSEGGLAIFAGNRLLNKNDSPADGGEHNE
ncbi:MAG: L-serine ammonia-lyase, iron-sulfur-dependent, subunit alpha [Bacteroidales bacterium]|jgi:L-serine dehydratase|nr:L-serine ammonia-lyase, iron-sulfur-dependent, subunit alpha [Bacteroidales bacterium]